MVDKRREGNIIIGINSMKKIMDIFLGPFLTAYFIKASKTVGLKLKFSVGATDSFITKQMQIIVGKITAIASLIGFVFAVPVLMMILATSRSARIGLMSTLSLSGNDWIALFVLTILITIFSVYITKKTTLKILSENRWNTFLYL